MSNTAIILAAGNGTRMKADKSKLLLEINGMTVIEDVYKRQVMTMYFLIPQAACMLMNSLWKNFKTFVQPFIRTKYCL